MMGAFLSTDQYCVTALRANASSVAVERVKEVDAAIIRKKDGKQWGRD